MLQNPQISPILLSKDICSANNKTDSFRNKFLNERMLSQTVVFNISSIKNSFTVTTLTYVILQYQKQPDIYRPAESSELVKILHKFYYYSTFLTYYIYQFRIRIRSFREAQFQSFTPWQYLYLLTHKNCPWVICRYILCSIFMQRFLFLTLH